MGCLYTILGVFLGATTRGGCGGVLGCLLRTCLWLVLVVVLFSVVLTRCGA